MTHCTITKLLSIRGILLLCPWRQMCLSCEVFNWNNLFPCLLLMHSFLPQQAAFRFPIIFNEGSFLLNPEHCKIPESIIFVFTLMEVLGLLRGGTNLLDMSLNTLTWIHLSWMFNHTYSKHSFYYTLLYLGGLGGHICWGKKGHRALASLQRA